MPTRTRHPVRRPRVAAVGSVALLAAALVGCAGSGGATGSGSTTGAVTISEAWVRAPMTPQGPAAAYLVIANTGSADDALLGVGSPAAEAAEVHEMTMGDDGSMGMRPVERLAIPAGGRLELKSGGNHIMLIGLRSPLGVGDRVELTLRFERAGPVTVTAEVRAG